LITFLIILALLIAPAGILFYYFWIRDRWEHEPPSLIWKLFALGGISIIPAVVLDIAFFGLENNPETIFETFMFAFIAAGLIEETCKFFFIYNFTKRSRHFNEEYDGILYAVAVGLGFAFFENILYVVGAMMDESGGLSIAILRAFTAVPMHALDGVILGYFIGRSHFEKTAMGKLTQNLMGLCMAVLFHGLYDFFAFLTMVIPDYAGWCIVGLVWIMFVQWATAYRFIRAAQISSKARWDAFKEAQAEQIAAPVIPSKKFCRHCGSTVNPVASFCSNCGGDIR
jgi:RsiW-degrading membrane proteinase PrsW (M82 family)